MCALTRSGIGHTVAWIGGINFVCIRKFQESYLETVPEMAPKIVEGYRPSVKKATFFGNIFGKKKQDNGKSFWFHGV